MDSPHDPDQLASALIDGLLSPADAAAALADPVVAARVAAMKEARSALRALPPADPQRRERSIAAALDAALGDPASEAPGAAPLEPAATAHQSLPGAAPPPTSLAARRHRRPAFASRWLGAAAAVVLLLAIGGVLVARSSSDHQASEQANATANDDAAARTPGGTTGGASGGAAPSAAPTTTVPGAGLAAGTDLGPVASADELADRAAATLEARSTASAMTDEPGDGGASAAEAAPGGDVQDVGRCPLPAPPGATGPIVLRATATLDGERVDVRVYAGPAGRQLVVTDSTCAVVVDRSLDG